ncbi:hypothetical protein ARMSODRAFT_973363 [Armillaria solidipes]|uniref:Uncharacterized protein n=1 Tax=Armillaria solidipes TaxID=1076256 RepID=A0A2H3BLQ1_9AGAR|nr:hypothetical protein ARMSODRAFT_973363 [Armillaria solidipes]
MLMIDSMHCILEGLIHYHCLNVLEIDLTKAGKARRFLPAFAYPWTTYSVNKAAELGCPMPNDSYSKDIAAIHKLLVQPIGDGKPLEDGIIVDVAVETLKKSIFFNDISLTIYKPSDSVIKNTSTPSWINSVPSNYGEALAALVTLWGDNNSQPLPDNSWNLLKKWVDGLYSVHPHMQTLKKRPNVHTAFHLYEFVISFGPIMGWWCFPFERLIGSLQKINTNDHVGECPQHVWEFKCLLDKALPPKDQREMKFEADLPMLTQISHAYYTYHNVTYSWASMHLGGSLVCYYLHSASSGLRVGSIQDISMTPSSDTQTSWRLYFHHGWLMELWIQFIQNWSTLTSCDTSSQMNVPSFLIYAGHSQFDFWEHHKVDENHNAELALSAYQTQLEHCQTGCKWDHPWAQYNKSG